MDRSYKNYSAKCRSNQSAEHKQKLALYYLNNIENFITRKTYTTISEDTKKKRHYDIDIPYIKELYNNNPHCSITGLKFTHNKSLTDLSIDRINNNLGHIKGNIQLVCVAINLAKNKHSNQDITDYLCHIRGTNKIIIDKFSRDYISTCVRNAKFRADCKRFDFELTTDYIIELFNKQNGLCYYTNSWIFAKAHPTVSLSIDRVNNNLGYTKSNIVLTSKALNRMRGNRPIDDLKSWLKLII